MEDMVDPLGDRVMKNVPPIARFPLKRGELWQPSKHRDSESATTGVALCC